MDKVDKYRDRNLARRAAAGEYIYMSLAGD